MNPHDHRRAIRITIATLPPPNETFCSAGCPKFVKASESCRWFGRLEELRESVGGGPIVRYIVRHKRCLAADAGPIAVPVPATPPMAHGYGCRCLACGGNGRQA